MSYIVYHPETGTILRADEAIIVNTRNLPDDFDEWEEYLAQNVAPRCVPGWRWISPGGAPWLDVQGMIEDRIGI